MGSFRFTSLFDRSTRIGTLFGIPIRLHITILFFLWPALAGSRFGFWYAVEYSVGIVLSILIHELGHALTAKRYGLTGLSITLHGFGGFASSSGVRSPRQALRIVLAGPAATFALGFLLLLAGYLGRRASAPDSQLADQFYLLFFLGELNVLMGFLNLVPILPWDGGQAFQAVLAHRMSEFKAMRAAAHVGLLVCVLLLVAWLVLKLPLMSLFLLVGFVTCLSTLLNSGGIRFGETLADRRHRKEMERVRHREAARTQEYLDQVKDREREREERERLRKLFEASGVTDDE
jgi:Zn-dependent protease